MNISKSHLTIFVSVLFTGVHVKERESGYKNNTLILVND
jgi:hypothetical protein